MKKRSRSGAGRKEEGLDKPSYAMDVFEEKSKKPAKEKPKEEAFHVGDSIGTSAAAQLAKLKEQLVDREEKAAPVKQSTKRKVSRQSAEDRLAQNPELSFAELFDPQEDEESSFADMLKDSKLDWRAYKED